MQYRIVAYNLWKVCSVFCELRIMTNRAHYQLISTCRIFYWF